MYQPSYRSNQPFAEKLDQKTDWQCPIREVRETINPKNCGECDWSEECDCYE